MGFTGEDKKISLGKVLFTVRRSRASSKEIPLLSPLIVTRGPFYRRGAIGIPPPHKVGK